GGRAGARRGAPSGQEGPMLISPAYAQIRGAGGSDMLMSLLPFILIFVIMYFLILRPQQRRAKQHQDMVKNVRRGDTVITTGGLIAKVTKVVDDDKIEIDLGDGGGAMQMRQMGSDGARQGEPLKDESA